ncbi:MAG: glycine cleavage system protein GcvH [Gammaproteobacteria bacterium]|jgi:glycine cleavage system H protein
MSNIPVEMKYAKTHEWARINDDGSVSVGISDSAQDQLGDMVFIEVPEVGQTLTAEEACAVVESVKAASDVYSPVGGEVVEVNGRLAETPEIVNQDPYGEGWIFRLKASDEGEMAALMDADQYEAFLESEGH